MMLLYLVSVICLVVLLGEIEQRAKGRDLVMLDGIGAADEAVVELESICMIRYGVHYQVGEGAGWRFGFTSH